MATLDLFAYHNYSKYRANRAAYLDLRPPQLKKLKMISVADAAQKSKVLHYADLMRDLELDTVRELEDLIIDCIYNELISGQLDQLNQLFHVVSCYGRDLRPADLGLALAKLEAWDQQLQEAQAFVEARLVSDCNANVKNNYERQLREQELIEKRRKEVLEDISNPKLGK